MDAPRRAGKRFFNREASRQRCCPITKKCRNTARIDGICLECAAIFSHLPLTIRCRLGDYTRAMMIKRILTMCAALTAAGAAGTSLALAQQGYQVPPPGSVYSPAPPPYPPGGGYPADYRRAPAAPDFDALEDDDAPGSTALSPPGPPPAYSDRGVPLGPILSPDDPRYGRPDGPPPVIYSNRPGQPQPAYSDRGNDQSHSGIRHRLSQRRQSRPAPARGDRGSDRRYRNGAGSRGCRRQTPGVVRVAAG